MSVTTKTRESTDSIVTLRDVSWETYERLRSADGNRGVRMTYDHGVLHSEFHVPEIWRWVEDRIEVYRLTDGVYAKLKQSLSLPGFPFEQVLKILNLRYEIDETSLVRKFPEAISA